MRKVLWSICGILLVLGVVYCSEDHKLPAKFHEARIAAPENLEARFEDGNVILQWNADALLDVFYYIVTVAEGTTGAEWQYTAPRDQASYTVEFTWTDSLYIFHVQAVDATNFVGVQSNVDTVLIP